MKYPKWFLHPVLIFVFSILALGLSLFLYIYWYVEVSSRLQSVIGRFDLDPGQFFELETWVVIVTLSILVALILVGIFIIFVYNVKTVQLYRLQHNFINNFTHELKTPVTSIRLYLETFQKHQLDRDQQLKYIDYMLADISRLTANINRILNLARIESGSYKGEFVPLDMVTFIREFQDKNRHLFPSCEIRILDPQTMPLICSLDPALFEILLMNVFTNAMKYNDSERPEIKVSFQLQGNNVSLCFSDNGIGIEKNDLKKIFKKFYQTKNSKSRQEGGSGLGLYLVDRIVKIHTGKVSAMSQGLGQGTTVTVSLPHCHAP